MPRAFTSEEARRAGRVGGQKSGEARAARRHSPDYKTGYNSGWEAGRREARDVLRRLNAIVPQMDNGYCAICRLEGHHGYRSSDGKGNVLVNCSNADCLSYAIAKVLA